MNLELLLIMRNILWNCHDGMFGREIRNLEASLISGSRQVPSCAACTRFAMSNHPRILDNAHMAQNMRLSLTYAHMIPRVRRYRPHQEGGRDRLATRLQRS